MREDGVPPAKTDLDGDARTCRQVLAQLATVKDALVKKDSVAERGSQDHGLPQPRGPVANLPLERRLDVASPVLTARQPASTLEVRAWDDREGVVVMLVSLEVDDQPIERIRVATFGRLPYVVPLRRHVRRVDQVAMPVDGAVELQVAHAVERKVAPVERVPQAGLHDGRSEQHVEHRAQCGLVRRSEQVGEREALLLLAPETGYAPAVRQREAHSATAKFLDRLATQGRREHGKSVCMQA
jgi:hypothetical protein